MLPNYLQFSDNPTTALATVLDEMNPDKVAMLVDENTRRDCLPLLNTNAEIIEIKSGEINKTLTTCEQIWTQMTDWGFSRKSLLVNIGGGVIGDMGGFAASTYKRGIRFVNFPSTLLSMVDASIGGKLGIDFGGLKNHIGVFQNPEGVIICDSFLKTLPKEQVRSGFAEVLKHALITDGEYWSKVRGLKLDEANWSEIIRRSVDIKQEVVNKDPKEAGLRKILNFGHSLGHAIETEYLDTDRHLLHGEAIAVGMILEADIATQRGLLDEITLDEIVSAIKSFFETPELPNTETLLKHLQQDKKNQGETLNFSLIDRIGNCQWDVPVTLDEIEISLKNYLLATERV